MSRADGVHSLSCGLLVGAPCLINPCPCWCHDRPTEHVHRARMTDPGQPAPNPEPSGPLRSLGELTLNDGPGYTVENHGPISALWGPRLTRSEPPTPRPLAGGTLSTFSGRTIEFPLHAVDDELRALIVGDPPPTPPEPPETPENAIPAPLVRRYRFRWDWSNASLPRIEAAWTGPASGYLELNVSQNGCDPVWGIGVEITGPAWAQRLDSWWCRRRALRHRKPADDRSWGAPPRSLR